MLTAKIFALRRRVNTILSRIPGWMGLSSLLLTASIMALMLADTTQASPSTQSGGLDVRIKRITLYNAIEDTITGSFDRGARIRAEVEVEDLRDAASIASDAPNYQAEYTLSFAISSTRAGVVYQGRDDPANLKTVTLTPGKEDIVDLIWNVPYGFTTGEYDFRVEISTQDRPNLVEHFLEREFRVTDDSRYVHISQKRIDFGNVVDEETPRSDLIVVAPVNRDAADLTWRVTDWPSGWLNLVEPALDPQDPTRSVELTNNGYVVLQVKETALFGNFSDDVVISSNAGEFKLKATAKINRHASGRIELFGVDYSTRQVVAGNTVNFRYRIKNTGRTDVRYRVTFIVVNPANAVVYDSSKESGHDQIIDLADGDASGNLAFQWQVPFGSLEGNYRVGIELRNAHDFSDSPYDSIAPTSSDAEIFKVLEGAKIRVSPTEWQFGSVLEHSTQNQETAVNVLNVGKPPFQWEVISVPQWIELLRPLSKQTTEGAVILRLKEGVAIGSHSGVMTIDSNGGQASVTLGVNIRSGAGRTSTPTPTAIPTVAQAALSSPTATNTPAPTDTPEPTATSVPTDTPVPAATDTPVVIVVTATPVPTDTPAPTATPEPTATPVPTATHTPTPEPTATRTPAPPTATAVPPTNTAAPPTETAVPPTATHTPEPEPTLTPVAEPSAASTAAPPPPTAIQPGASDTPPGGACSESPQPVSPLTGLVNMALLLSPVALAGGARWRKRRKSDGG